MQIGRLGKIAKGRFEPLLTYFCFAANVAFAKDCHDLARKKADKAARHYEQKGHRTQPTPLGQYLKRWNAWFQGDLRGIELRGASLPAFEGSYASNARQQEQSAGR